MLLDASGEFYFLEMNTRLQVEHPVSELVSGLDFVLEQIRVAEGRPLSFSQKDLRFGGHAIEARVYAEDPEQGFLPQSGRVLLFEAPTGPGIRVETGVQSGDEVSLHYDPMIAKVCAFGASREEARQRLVTALRDTVLLGLTTNLPHLVAVLEHPAFAAGEVHTAFLPEHLGDWHPDDAADVLACAVASWLGSKPARSGATPEVEGPPELWPSAAPLRLTEEASWKPS
jgi:acetyl/propionyl-CoA carboxylase alpha subunit